MGGLAELKRRKQEKELAERGGADAAEEKSKPSEAEEGQQPGQLKHVSLRSLLQSLLLLYLVLKKGDNGLRRARGGPDGLLSFAASDLGIFRPRRGGFLSHPAVLWAALQEARYAPVSRSDVLRWGKPEDVGDEPLQ